MEERQEKPQKVDLRELTASKICYRSDPRNLKPPYVLVFLSRRHEINEDVVSKVVADLTGRGSEEAKNSHFSIVGIFVPTSEAERREDAVKRSISFNLPHSPVILDENMEIKDRFKLQKLPAIIITDEEGFVEKTVYGFEKITQILIEHRRRISSQVGSHSRDFRSPNPVRRRMTMTMEEEHLEIIFEMLGRKMDCSKCCFEIPGKMAYTRRTKLLAITDRGRKQVLLFSYGGFWELVDIIGREGGSDRMGDEYETDFSRTSFSGPDCVCFTESGRFLLIGDQFSGMIKVADILIRRIVGFIEIPGPRHISGENSSFLIASAVGKIFRMELREETIRRTKSFEDLTQKTSISEMTARFELPSAVLTTEDKRIIVVDSGDSSIKEIRGDGRAHILVGGSDEGFSDGSLASAKLCFPKSAETFKDVVFIADTLNNSIRIMIEGRLSTIMLTNTEFCEPEEVRLAAGILMVSDTGNRRVLEIEPVRMEGVELRLSDGSN